MSEQLIGKVLLEQFRVDAFVAAGGMGSVYKVWDLQRSAWLAMKALHTEFSDDPDSFKRFQREANALRKLAHPNIVPFYGIFKTDEFAFLLQRYIDGPSLSKVIKDHKGQPFSILDALTYLRAISSALGYAHHNDVVHCDVKPGNVLIDSGGGIYLTDFGIARHADSTATTFAGAGTPAYMSPEQVRGQSLTAASDVYALAVVLFEMLTGQRPFRGEAGPSGGTGSGATAAERIRAAHLSQPPPDPRRLNPQISPALAAAILRGLEKDPARRPASAPAFFDTVCAAAGVVPSSVPERAGQGAVAPPTHPGVQIPPIPQPVRRSWLPFALGGGGLFILLAVAWAIMALRAPAAPAVTSPVAALVQITATRPAPTLTRPAPTATLQPTVAAATSTSVQAAAAASVPTLLPPPARDLAFASNRDGKFSVYLMNSNDPSDWQAFDNPQGYDRVWHPTFCGDMIAVEAVSQDRAFPDWIYFIDPASGAITQFDPPGAAPQVIAAPRCSPHGNLLAYSANRDDAWYLMIANLARNKKAFQYRGENYSLVGYAAWEFAEEAIYWMGVSEDFRTFFIRRTGDLSSENGQTSPMVNGKYPALSPDGDLLAYYEPSRLALCVVRLPGLSQVFCENIRYDLVQSETMPSTAMWSGDGQWLYYSSAEDGDWDIYRVSRDGGTIENMTKDWKTDELTPAIHW